MKVFKIIIILGPPGAGKGTQAILLSEKFDLYHFETSKILEEGMAKAKEKDFIKVEGKKYFFKDERKRWEEGKLCSPPFVTFLVKEKIKELKKIKKGIVFSGSPRTLYEGKKIIPLLERLYGKENLKVILLKISVKTSLFRNSHRRICTLFRHPILYNRQTKNLKICPLDGSPLIRRALDKPEVIKVRFKKYQERTLPLVRFFKERNLKVIEIDGTPPPSKVYESILKSL